MLNADNLTKREFEVLYWTVRGLTAKKIGRVLNISDKTSARHIENICKKSSIKDKSSLIEEIFKTNLIQRLL